MTASQSGVKIEATGRSFEPGVYCPLITPFKGAADDYAVDYAAIERQVVRLANAGMGIVLLGTNGEANHLSDSERSTAITKARAALDKAGHKHLPILVGTGTGSAQQTVKLCKDAAEAGADAAIVIFPGYFAFNIGKNREAIANYFNYVFDHSPIKVMIYNFPGAASGVDLDSDTVIALSEHKNCFGVKLTCAGVAKGQRIAIHTQSDKYVARHGGNFLILPGFSDYLFSSVVARQNGCITGTGNVFPKTIVALWNAINEFQRSPSAETLAKAQALQDRVSVADWTIVKVGIPGTKYALDSLIEKGLGGVCRQPLPVVSEADKQLVDNDLKDAIAFENSL